MDFRILCFLKIWRVSWFVQKRILFLQREFSPSVENRARIITLRDDANPVLWAGILLFAAAGAGTAVFYRRKADH